MLTWSLQYTALSKGSISHMIGLVELEWMQPGRRSTRDPKVYWCSWRVVVIGVLAVLYREGLLCLSLHYCLASKRIVLLFLFFLFSFWSCRLIQGSRRFSCCVSGFWVGVSCSGAPYIHRCIGVLRKLLGLGMGFLLTCEEMACTDFYSITVWLLKGFFCFSFFSFLFAS